MTFLCMVEVRNKTAYTFLLPFGNVLAIFIKNNCGNPELLLPW